MSSGLFSHLSSWHSLVQPPPPGRPPESPGSEASPLQSVLYTLGNGFASRGSFGFGLAFPASMGLCARHKPGAPLSLLTACAALGLCFLVC